MGGVKLQFHHARVRLVIEIDHGPDLYTYTLDLEGSDVAAEVVTGDNSSDVTPFGGDPSFRCLAGTLRQTATVNMSGQLITMTRTAPPPIEGSDGELVAS